MHFGTMLSCHLLGKAFFLLVLSFFTMLGISKTDSSKLKKFGRILVAIMWGLAIGIVASAIYTGLTGQRCMFGKKYLYKKHHYKKMMQQLPGAAQEKLPSQMIGSE